VKVTPGIVLKTQFVTDKGFMEKNINYISRSKALSEKEKEIGLTVLEATELDRLTNILDNNPDEVISNAEHLNQYVDYMVRKKAVERRMDYFKKNDSTLNKDVVTGTFTSDNRYPTYDDMEALKEKIKNVSEDGNIMFTDVLSFDNEFLIEQKILDPETNNLDEDKIFEAVSKMINVCIKEEKMENTFWVGAIHRNTDNIHIHTTLMEEESTRPQINNPDTGKLEYKGKRSQKTIDKMKNSVANSLEMNEHTKKIGALRDKTAKQFRESIKNDLLNKYKSGDIEKSEELKLLNDIYKEIPVKAQGYNDKKISDATRQKVDKLVDSLTEGNANKFSYLDEAKKLDNYYTRAFGDNHKEGVFYEKRVEELKGRLGNGLVRNIIQDKKDELKVSIKEEYGNDKKKYREKALGEKFVGKEQLKKFSDSNNLYQYSPNNQDSIKAQNKDATFVLNKEKWKELGIEVNDNSISIEIVKPVKDEKGKTSFQKQNVYDISAFKLDDEKKKDIIENINNQNKRKYPKQNSNRKEPEDKNQKSYHQKRINEIRAKQIKNLNAQEPERKLPKKKASDLDKVTRDLDWLLQDKSEMHRARYEYESMMNGIAREQEQRQWEADFS